MRSACQRAEHVPPTRLLLLIIIISLQSRKWPAEAGLAGSRAAWTPSLGCPALTQHPELNPWVYGPARFTCLSYGSCPSNASGPGTY